MCGEIETVEHILFECQDKRLECIIERPNRLDIALGFQSEESESVDIVKMTKCILHNWFVNR